MTEIEYIEIDPVTRKILSPAGMLLGVMEDANVERKYFKCPKIVGDNVDLSAHQIYIKYTQSLDKNGEQFEDVVPGIYHCEDVSDEGDYITFSWKLSGNVCVEKGFIAFSVVASDGDEVRWNTYPSVGTVLLTIPGGLEEVAKRYPDIISQLLNRMDEVEAIATPEAMQNYVEAYFTENPPSGMTNEEREQLNKNTEDISSLSEEMENIINGSSTGAGWNDTQISLLETLFGFLVYTDNITGQTIADNLISSLRSSSSGGNNEGSGGDSGNIETPTNYTITNSLTNVTTDNDASIIEANGLYTANLTADSGYYIDSVIVTMGGENVTDSVYANGVITISEVTGKVVIVASGAESDNLLTAEILAKSGAGSLPDGTRSDGTAISITPFIAVEPNTTYKFNIREYIPDGHYCYELKTACYDSEQTYKKVVQYLEFNATSFTTPEYCYFIKLMFFTGHPNPYFGKSGVIV